MSDIFFCDKGLRMFDIKLLAKASIRDIMEMQKPVAFFFHITKWNRYRKGLKDVYGPKKKGESIVCLLL